MQLQFHKEAFGWMRSTVCQIQTQELTQELKLADGMPDIGRILGSWGQPVLRSKEWRKDGFSVSGGLLVWVLYSPEDDTQPRFLGGWIPWQMNWELPDGLSDGQIRVCCRPRFVDARSVSPRKVMVRAGISVLGDGLVPAESFTWSPGEVPEDVQLLVQTYPMRLTVEAGEKVFQIEEDLVLPGACPVPARLVSYSIHCQVSESRVLSSRVLFRGTANVHAVYLNEEGKLSSWDFPVSISQYEDLKGSFGNDAQAEFWIEPSELDLQLDDDGHFRMKATMIAQYAVDDVRMLPVTEDAYSPLRELDMDQTEQTLLPVLDHSTHEISVQQVIPQEVDKIADSCFLPDFPRQRHNGDQMELEQTGTIQILYYNPEGMLRSAGTRWEGKKQMQLHQDASVRAIPSDSMVSEVQITAEGIRFQGTLPVDIRTSAQQNLAAITGVELGREREPEPGRPSLVLCRAGEYSLWQIARENGSTVHAIREATGLEGDPHPGQMLLIPVI